MTIHIEKLDLEDINPSTENMDIREQGGSKILIIGKAGTGKSRLILDILYKKSHIFPSAVVFSGTEDSNGYYSRHIPSVFVHDELKLDVLQKTIERQKLAIQQGFENPWNIVLIDDCADDPSLFRKNKIIQGIFKNGRHWKTLFIFALQYCFDVPPYVRTNADGVFIFKENSRINREKLWKNYAGVIPTFKLFCEIMDAVTENYGALYIKNDIDSNNWEDCVFWYKAEKVPRDFRVGDEAFWSFAQDRENR